MVLGIGLFLSTISNTQQQLMFMAFFFMITFILMSGVFTPAESMPLWAQKINLLNPAAYFMRVIRMILLKGSEFRDISREFYSLCIYAASDPDPGHNQLPENYLSSSSKIFSVAFESQLAAPGFPAYHSSFFRDDECGGVSAE